MLRIVAGFIFAPLIHSILLAVLHMVGVVRPSLKSIPSGTRLDAGDHPAMAIPLGGWLPFSIFITYLAMFSFGLLAFIILRLLSRNDWQAYVLAGIVGGLAVLICLLAMLPKQPILVTESLANRSFGDFALSWFRFSSVLLFFAANGASVAFWLWVIVLWNYGDKELR